MEKGGPQGRLFHGYKYAPVHKARTWNFSAKAGVKSLMFGGLTAAPRDIRPYHGQPR
jgi:hypothetical protein